MKVKVDTTTEFPLDVVCTLLFSKEDLELYEEIKKKQMEREKEEALNNFKSYKDNSFIDSNILKAIPSNTVIPKDDLLFLIKSKLNPSLEEGKLVFKKDGEILKNNTTLEPLAIDKVFETYFAENKHYIKGVEGGQGGSDSSGQINPKGLDAYIKKASDSGVNVNSAEFSKQMSQAYASGEIVD